MQHRWLLPIILSIFVLPCICVSLARADVIYDTFDSGNQYSIVAAIISTDYSDHAIQVGNAFTPTLDYHLTSIELALTNYSIEAQSPLNVMLMTDDSGQPGSIIETFGLIGSNVSSIYTLPSASSPILLTGTTYWIVAVAPEPGSRYYWHRSNFATGLTGSTDFDGKWCSSTSPQEAFRVSGDPTPEPATMLLLGSGLTGLAAWRRRRRG